MRDQISHPHKTESKIIFHQNFSMNHNRQKSSTIQNFKSNYYVALYCPPSQLPAVNILVLMTDI